MDRVKAIGTIVVTIGTACVMAIVTAYLLADFTVALAGREPYGIIIGIKWLVAGVATFWIFRFMYWRMDASGIREALGTGRYAHRQAEVNR